MIKNIGGFDKVVRILIAAVVATLYLVHAISGVAAIVLGALAGILLLTSLVSLCPLYLPFGISTRKGA